MWVWIPRYIYRISSGWHTSTAGTIDVQFSKGVDDNWNKSVIGAIDVGETSNASNNKWTNHPAFTFGDTELTGIWVAKFETSGATNAVDSKPNLASLRNITIDSMFTSSRNMETNSRYGWGTSGDNIDTHMMKNSEWGAIAYLSQSIYGKNAEIWMNNSRIFTTGCAGASVSAAGFDGCEYAYDTANGQQASTTGNIYGIYDMSGGAWEYTSSYVDNGHTNLTTNGNSIIQAPSKYKDVYTIGATDTADDNYNLTINSKGDAVYETSTSGTGQTTWYGNYSYIPNNFGTWFTRGGDFNNSGSTAAGTFNFDRLMGIAHNYGSFRSVVLVGSGL
jgi:hypothetical protein